MTEVAELTGRALDAAVAERVMGWERHGCPPAVDFGPSVKAFWKNASGKTMCTETGTKGANHDTRRLSWSPSSEIAVAWRVVEKRLKVAPKTSGDSLGWNWPFELAYLDDEGVWTATFSDEDDTMQGYEGFGDTAPEAICRAALAAVGDDGR